jgi:hypothetical protein
VSAKTPQKASKQPAETQRKVRMQSHLLALLEDLRILFWVLHPRQVPSITPRSAQNRPIDHKQRRRVTGTYCTSSDAGGGFFRQVLRERSHSPACNHAAICQRRPIKRGGVVWMHHRQSLREGPDFTSAGRIAAGKWLTDNGKSCGRSPLRSTRLSGTFLSKRPSAASCCHRVNVNSGQF